MATGILKRTMVYLGLVDDDYESEYEDYEPTRAVSTRPARVVDEDLQPAGVAASSIRPLREEPTAAMASTAGSGGSVRSMVRPLPAEAAARVHVVAPMQFGDARQIADRLMGNQPVIVNLQVADRELMRRMIDFCSGVAYALNGKMERVADKVFLVTPSNVKVSAEERQRLQENGLLQA